MAAAASISAVTASKLHDPVVMTADVATKFVTKKFEETFTAAKVNEESSGNDRRNPQYHTLRSLKQAGRFLLTSTWSDKVSGKLINGNILQAARDAGQATRFVVTISVECLGSSSSSVPTYPVNNFEDGAKKSDFHCQVCQTPMDMLERGVYLAPSQYYEEVVFTLSLVHSVRRGH